MDTGANAGMNGDRRMAPSMPRPRGPLSDAILAALRDGVFVPPRDARPAEPYGDDLQLALYVCYELHYQGFDGVDPGWEWEPELLRLRGAMGRRVLAALRGELRGRCD